MSDYGLTPKGPNIKRLDTILDEMHSDLTQKLGVNTQQNPQSLLNHLLTNIADRLAELWELGEDVYFSQYPASAEGTSLDNAAQFGGITRETATKSYYPIHCTGVDGTVLAEGTQIASNTNPKTYLSITEEKTISRSSFNEAIIRVASARIGDTYTVILDGSIYSFIASTASQIDILNGIANAILSPNFTKTVDSENLTITIKSVDETVNHTLVLSENLTTETVTTIITFGTVELGDILIPNGSITEIVQADAGLTAVTNKCEYVAGRDAETDSELRKSYADKIFRRSSFMLESIRSGILNNVQGVESVAAYENTTDYATMYIICTGQETANSWYYFKYNDLYFRFIMPSVSLDDRLIFGSDQKVLTWKHGDTETPVNLTVSYSAPAEKKYTCLGTETQNALYYFLHDGLYYIFAMPSVNAGNKLEFDESNKKLYKAVGGSKTQITLDAGFTTPKRLAYTCTGSETANALYYFNFESVFYSFTMPSGVASGDKLVFNQELKTLTREHGETQTSITLTASSEVPKGVKTLEYECDGTEVSGSLTFFSYESVKYAFSMPNTADGDKLIFNTSTKSLKRKRGTTETSISKTASMNAPSKSVYDVDENVVPEADYYFSLDGLYYLFTMPATAADGDTISFNPYDNRKLMHTSGETSTEVGYSCSSAQPGSGTSITGDMTSEAIGDNITDDLEVVQQTSGTSITLAQTDRTANNITSSMVSTPMEISNLTDRIASGIPPHSIEIVVEGGDPNEIAEQILKNKAGGITTYGSQSVVIKTSYDEEITVNFNRPIKLYVWFKLQLTLRNNETLPQNYATLLKNVIVEEIASLDAGDDVVPQEFMSELYNACPGIAYIDISLYGTQIESQTHPVSYPSRTVDVTDRQRAYTTAEMIEVTIPNG